MTSCRWMERLREREEAEELMLGVHAPGLLEEHRMRRGRSAAQLCECEAPPQVPSQELGHTSGHKLGRTPAHTHRTHTHGPRGVAAPLLLTLTLTPASNRNRQP